MNTDTLASPQAPVRSPAPASRDPFPATSSSSRPQVDGKFLKVDGKRFWIKGVTYGSFSPNDEGEPYPAFHRLKDDFARMADAGINTVRLYNAPTPRIADAAWKAGLRLIPEVGWGPRFCELGTDREDFLYQWAKDRTCELAGHPAVLMYSIGNEVPPLVVRWYGVERVSQFLRRLCNIVKEHSDGGLVTYVNHPPTEYLNLPNFDVVSYNIYLENERTFRSYLARLHSLAGERPLFLAELGLDSAKNGRDAQAAFLHQYLRATFEKGLCGTAVYSWTDEWSIFDEAIEGWAFGITDSERHPKPALEVVSETYRLDHYQMSQRQWPRVTVVVATYNGSRTLATCLESLGRLNYPNYEVLVVDDGSTQPIDEIASRYPVHYHRIQPNGGLSNARNTGMKLASGKIVDYIDDDTFADPDWLFFMVQSLLEQGASAVGGPNLSPPDEKFTAQCVHHSPGNPTCCSATRSRNTCRAATWPTSRTTSKASAVSTSPTAPPATTSTSVGSCWSARRRSPSARPPSSGTAAARRSWPISSSNGDMAMPRRTCTRPTRRASTCSATASGRATSTTDWPPRRSARCRRSSARGSTRAFSAARCSSRCTSRRSRRG
jgi:hypothetical protein